MILDMLIKLNNDIDLHQLFPLTYMATRKEREHQGKGGLALLVINNFRFQYIMRKVTEEKPLQLF